uniref:DUF382 domain-containing protein n=1 Tax=Tetranychus urticae TaxID=32264 RepID=T1JSX2_TETUR
MESQRDIVSGAEKPVDMGVDTDLPQKILQRKPVELEFVEDNEPKVSKRKSKLHKRMTVAELKQKVAKPEIVEMHYITAKDPLLLLNLKSTRNSVPVPRYWCFKRKYLQGKRGFEKPGFKLPDFIKKNWNHGNGTIQREKIRPQLGKIDIDYQKIHDAIFKWRTKPKMTIHGDIYFEGKEYETRLKEKKPDDLSVELRVALGMPLRYGPPPSYPNRKISMDDHCTRFARAKPPLNSSQASRIVCKDIGIYLQNNRRGGRFRVYPY